MEIKVLGPGCSKCEKTFRLIGRLIEESRLDVQLVKVDDIMELLNYGVVATPAVVVDGVVRLKGHVPTESEVRELLGI